MEPKRRRASIFAAGLFPKIILIMALSASMVAASESPRGEMVLGVNMSGYQRAYPLSVFEGRQAVNDSLGNLALVVFYDRSREFAAAYFRLVGGDPLEFSEQARELVLEDRTTATKWDMRTGRAVGGNLGGRYLVPIPLHRAKLDEWLATYPKSSVFGLQ